MKAILATFQTSCSCLSAFISQAFFQSINVICHGAKQATVPSCTALRPGQWFSGREVGSSRAKPTLRLALGVGRLSGAGEQNGLSLAAERHQPEVGTAAGCCFGAQFGSTLWTSDVVINF